MKHQEQDIESVVDDLLKDTTFMEDLQETFHPDNHLPNPKGLTPEGQIKKGHLYQIGGNYISKKEKTFCIITGYAGVLEFVKTFREAGFSDAYILNDIQVLDTEGIMTNTKYIPLINVIWKKT